MKIYIFDIKYIGELSGLRGHGLFQVPTFLSTRQLPGGTKFASDSMSGYLLLPFDQLKRILPDYIKEIIP